MVLDGKTTNKITNIVFLFEQEIVNKDKKIKIPHFLKIALSLN